MNRSKKTCFVIMPCSPELHYFYLYIKKYTEEVHNIQCERADDQVLTMPILDKINDFIRNADAIIADCSGRNPNVFMNSESLMHKAKKSSSSQKIQ